MFVSLIIDLCEIIGVQHDGLDDCFICSIKIPRNLVDIQDEKGQTNERLTSTKVGLVSFSFHIPPIDQTNCPESQPIPFSISVKQIMLRIKLQM